jgi:hypothetical protein
LALLDQSLSFRPDSEQVIAPVVDYAPSRPEVDPACVALMGDSQGGYRVPRAVGFEQRVAAAMADPGVWDVSTSWLAGLPEPLLHLLASGNKPAFDQALKADVGDYWRRSPQARTQCDCAGRVRWSPRPMDGPRDRQWHSGLTCLGQARGARRRVGDRRQQLLGPAACPRTHLVTIVRTGGAEPLVVAGGPW